MEYVEVSCPILKKGDSQLFDFMLESKLIASKAKAGQFVQIQVPGFFLRRPISICEVDPQNGTIRIIFDIRGEGTAVLAKSQVGNSLDVLGPLGNGFTLMDNYEHVVVVGGGIGVPPLLQIVKHYKDRSTSTAILGFQGSKNVILTNDFNNYGAEVLIATEDGSVGSKGFVTNPLREHLASNKTDIVYACGPKGMLKAVSALCMEFNVKCEISLEERMACGVGACLGCACKTKRQDGSQTYSHVCKNGPVFDAKEVVFDD